MGKLSFVIGLAALAGAGFYIGKKLIEKKELEDEDRVIHMGEEEPEIFVEEKHSSPKEKLQKASLFAVGAIKTSTDKFKEGVDDILNSDMVKKGEDALAETKEAVANSKAVKFAKDAKEKTVDFAKGAGETVLSEIENIKNKMASINTTPAEEEPAPAEDLAEAIKQDVDEFTEKAVDLGEELQKKAEPIVEQFTEKAEDIKEEIKEEVGEETEKLEPLFEEAEDKAEDVGEIIGSAAEEAVKAFEDLGSEEKPSDELDNFHEVNFGPIETFDFSEGPDDDPTGGSAL